MDFLKGILEDDLIKQINGKINEYNEANKDNQIKLGNLGAGDYVAKGKYDNIQTLLTGKNDELTNANELITRLKKATKNDEDAQLKITNYEKALAKAEEDRAEMQKKYAIRLGFAKEGITDADVVEFLTDKLIRNAKEKGNEVTVDANENIKGWDDYITSLKTQTPRFFETTSGSEKKLVDVNKLPNNENKDALSKTELLKKPYAERMQIYNDNPEAYKAAMNN